MTRKALAPQRILETQTNSHTLSKFREIKKQTRRKYLTERNKVLNLREGIARENRYMKREKE